jgi:hypothetical protein
MKLDPYYNPESEHYAQPTELVWTLHDAPTLSVRRVCSTQSEVRVYSNSPERWHYLACPIVTVTPETSGEWIGRQTDNVIDALIRIARAKWIDGKTYRKVITELRRAKALNPPLTYKVAKQ